MNNIEKKRKIQLLRDFFRMVDLHKGERINTIKVEKSGDIDQLKKITENLIPLYNKKKNEIIKHFTDHWNKYKIIFSPTTFEVMKFHAREEVHSNVIAHLMRNKQIGKILIQELLHATGNDQYNEIISFISKESFNVTREKAVRGKRIDISIEGPSFIIVIENKFKDSIRDIGENQRQTDFYYNEIKELYPSKKQAFLILDYKGIEESPGYYMLDYEDLLHCMERLQQKVSEVSSDTVFIEYINLLRRLEYKLTEFDINITESISLSNLNKLYQDIQWI